MLQQFRSKVFISIDKAARHSTVWGVARGATEMFVAPDCKTHFIKLTSSKIIPIRLKLKILFWITLKLKTAALSANQAGLNWASVTSSWKFSVLVNQRPLNPIHPTDSRPPQDACFFVFVFLPELLRQNRQFLLSWCFWSWQHAVGWTELMTMQVFRTFNISSLILTPVF